VTKPDQRALAALLAPIACATSGQEGPLHSKARLPD
jgi:hypothetical protein